MERPLKKKKMSVSQWMMMTMIITSSIASVLPASKFSGKHVVDNEPCRTEITEYELCSFMKEFKILKEQVSERRRERPEEEEQRTEVMELRRHLEGFNRSLEALNKSLNDLARQMAVQHQVLNNVTQHLQVPYRFIADSVIIHLDHLDNVTHNLNQSLNDQSYQLNYVTRRLDVQNQTLKDITEHLEVQDQFLNNVTRHLNRLNNLTDHLDQSLSNFTRLQPSTTNDVDNVNPDQSGDDDDDEEKEDDGEQSGDEPECPAGFRSENNGCYLIIYDKLSWTEARVRCQRNHSRAHLVVINSAFENDAIARFVRSQSVSDCYNRGLTEMWTSGRRKISSCRSSFEWEPFQDNAASVTYTNWHSKEPNCENGMEHCLSIWPHRSNTWNDVPCSARMCAVCETIPIFIESDSTKKDHIIRGENSGDGEIILD